MKKVQILIMALVVGFFGYTQEDIKEGVLVISQKMSSDNEQMNAQFSMMGDMTTTTYFKNDNSRTEVSSPMTGDVVVVTDELTKKMITLMDNPILGKKYIKGNLDANKDENNNITVKKGDETKTVLGYKCQQYFVTTNVEGQSMEMEIYATDAITTYSQLTAAFSSELKGYPLLMTMTMSQMGANITITSEVTEIKSESVADSKFSMTIPEGYDEMKQD